MIAGQKIINAIGAAEAALPFGKQGLSALRQKVETVHMRTLPDRLYFDTQIAPAIIKRAADNVLYVGVRSYTNDTLDQLVKNCAQVWTTDIEDEVAIFGNGDKHRTLDIADIDADSFPVSSFEVIVLNGIIGHGVNEPAHIEKLGAALAGVMPQGGLLISGWNTDKSPDPMTLQGFARYFEPAQVGTLPQRKPIDGMTHVYDVLARR